jgi:NADH:ubiquinone oxidoreductase subunit 3 (subunit A)
MRGGWPCLGQQVLMVGLPGLVQRSALEGIGMYDGVLAMIVVSLVVVSAFYLLHRGVAVSADPLVSLPFQSGWEPQEHALSRFHVRWYLATLLFLAFDVEMLFMYPWAVVVADLGATAVVEMFLFLGVLVVGVAWGWREGALRWA